MTKQEAKLALSLGTCALLGLPGTVEDSELPSYGQQCWEVILEALDSYDELQSKGFDPEVVVTEHTIKVLDLGIIKAITGGRTFGLEKWPAYRCTCGEGFDMRGEADSHVEEAGA